MLQAAERGTLQPDARAFNAATVPPEPPTGADEADDEEGDRPTEPGYVSPSSAPPLEARLQTPRAPGIPRAPLVPRFTPRENLAPSYAPPSSVPVVPSLDLEPLGVASADGSNDTVSAPPPSSSQHSAPPLAIDVDLDPMEGVHISVPALGERNTAPSPGAPGPEASEPPTVFAIATWLAERDFERARGAVEQLGAERSPELSLLETRALIGLGRKAAARRSLDRLCRAPLLEPDLRASVARLLLEVGDVNRAEAQARRAHTEDPDSGLARLTLAWSIARGDAWLLSPRSLTELSELLAGVAPEASPMPALVHALRAFTLLPRSAEAARQAADAALKLDGDLHDALAAAAVIAQHQGRAADVTRWRQRLLELDRHAANDLAAALESLRPPEREEAAPRAAVPAPASTSAPASRHSARTAAAPTGPSPWQESEQRLVLGDHRAALFEFEQALARRLETVPARASAQELSAAADLSARHLTQAPTSRHFAPFDFSLFSIQRLNAALGLLYRGSVGPRTELRTRVLLGLGAYVGECLRRAYAGEWIGSAVDLLRLHIEGQGLCFTPFRDMHARLQAGQELEVVDTPPAHPGAEPLGQRVALDIAPPTPWEPDAWPSLAQVGHLGSHLGSSPVGMFCEAVELPLDLSFASLRAVDRYVTLLAPPLAPPDPEAAWVKRAAVLVGAYVGEVLRATRGGSWELARGDLRPEAYRVSLSGGTVTLPIAAAFERLSGRRLEQPSDYARRIIG